MEPSKSTGPTVPAWIRDQIARHEEAWPLWALCGAAATVLVAGILLGACLWTSDPPVYYALP